MREELILSALSTELDNEMFREINIIEGMMAQHVKDKSEFFEKLYTKVFDYRRSLEFETETAEQKARKRARAAKQGLTGDPELDKLIRIYKEQLESGELAEVEKELRENIERFENRTVADKINMGEYDMSQLTYRMSESDD